MIVERYGASYGPTGGAGADDAITLAAIDTGALIRARNRVDTIASLLLGLLDADPTLAPVLWEARHDAFNFGDAYADLHRFLLGVRQRMIATGRMPERYARWTGDERARELRDTIDDLTGALWPELVLASRSGDLFPGTGGVSIFFPTDECGFALDLRRYAETPFAADTMWGTFVETMVRRHPQGAGVLAGRAQGTMSVTFDGLTWSDLPADCVLSGGVLEVYGYEGRCQNSDRGCRYAPQVSVELHATGDELGARTDHVWAESPRLEAQLGEADLAIEAPAVVPGSSYEATVATEVTVDGARLPLRASFRCAGLQPLSCDERGPSVRR
jgi:hypothetical protein